MDRKLRVFLYICLGAFVAAFVVQTLFQVPLGHERSVWGGNPGWQREIAFWNVGAGLIVWYTLRLADARLALVLVRGFTVLFLLLGRIICWPCWQTPRHSSTGHRCC